MAVLEYHVQSDDDKFLEICTASDKHLILEPFFRDNLGLQKFYKANSLGDKVEEVKTYSRKKLAKIPLQFSTGGALFYSNGRQMSENEWTTRLKGCLDLFLPERFHIKLTYADAGDFSRIQNGYSGLPVGLDSCYPFRGAPDIVISKCSNETVISCRNTECERGSDSEDEVTDEEVIENALKLSPQSDYCFEKTRQVLETLHSFITKKVLRNLLKKETAEEKFIVRGLLIHKLNGCVLCKMSVDLKVDVASPIKVNTRVGCAQSLSAASLCYYLQHLLDTSFH